MENTRNDASLYTIVLRDCFDRLTGLVIEFDDRLLVYSGAGLRLGTALRLVVMSNSNACLSQSSAHCAAMDSKFNPNVVAGLPFDLIEPDRAR